MIYLGTAYSHPDARVRNDRYVLAVRAAGVLAKLGILCYCPIASWHVVSSVCGLPGDHEFWLRQDSAMMNFSNEGWFVRSEGFDESAGCRHEMKTLMTQGKIVLIFNSLDELYRHARDYSA